MKTVKITSEGQPIFDKIITDAEADEIIESLSPAPPITPTLPEPIVTLGQTNADGTRPVSVTATNTLGVGSIGIEAEGGFSGSSADAEYTANFTIPAEPTRVRAFVSNTDGIVATSEWVTI